MYYAYYTLSLSWIKATRIVIRLPAVLCAMPGGDQRLCKRAVRNSRVAVRRFNNNGRLVCVLNQPFGRSSFVRGVCDWSNGFFYAFFSTCISFRTTASGTMLSTIILLWDDEKSPCAVDEFAKENYGERFPIFSRGNLTWWGFRSTGGRRVPRRGWRRIFAP